MSQAKKITLAAAALVIIVLLAIVGITGAANGTVDCPDCDGVVSTALCETCSGEGVVRGTLWALLPNPT